MKPANVFSKPALTLAEERKTIAIDTHPVWQAFIRHCAELQHGEIEILRIQDGLQVFAEVVRRKIKFTS